MSHIATIAIDGIPTFSYRGTPGKILAPTTMPHEIHHAIGALICDGAPFWVGSDLKPLSESHERRLRVRTLALTIRPLAQDGRGQWTLFAPEPTVTVTWTGTEDYR